MSLSLAIVGSTTFRWLPREIDLGFAGTSALITATLAVAAVWPLRLLKFARRARRRQPLPDVRFETLAALSSGGAALGAVIGLVFTIVGALSS